MEKDKKNKVLVTGAAGYIGSKLIRDLPDSLVGQIDLLDNMESQRHYSFYDLPNKFSYRFYEEDILNADLEKIIEGIDIVVHLAALTDAEKSHSRAIEVNAVNFEGLKRVADACKKNGTKLIFPSTTSVYGSQDSVVDEKCLELKPQSPYAASKIAAENYLREAGKDGLKFIICRFGTVFGYSIGMRFHTVVNKFTWQAVSGRPLSVWKTALKQKRPYLYIGDFIGAVNFIIKNDIFDGETYNALTGNFTVEDIVNTIKEFAPKLKIDFVDSPIMNQLSYDVSDEKFKKTGFEVSGNLRAGAKEAFDKLSGINGLK